MYILASNETSDSNDEEDIDDSVEQAVEILSTSFGQ